MPIIPTHSFHLLNLIGSPETSLEEAGGKGANLARLARAGFNVPRAVILSTGAYRDFVAANNLQTLILSALEQLAGSEPGALETASDSIRAAFSAGKMPVEIEDVLKEAAAALEGRSLAVRSSATLEDLPDLSFAGQQDTFLNIQGADQLKKAVIACWSSLWTARAIGYRARNQIPQDQAALAVVIQEMVASDVSGVLFTANPMSGLLSETVIDASLGLGEALVSGLVEPDHYVVDSQSGEIRSVTQGEKKLSIRAKQGGGVETVSEPAAERQSLTPAEVKALTETGQAIQAAFGTAQDIEWARADGQFFILQSRPVTSLFPVPEVCTDPLTIWFSFGAVQGLVGPLTPLGQDTIRHVAAAAGGMFGIKIDPAELKLFGSAGERMWIKISDLIRNPLGERIFAGALAFLEPSIGRIITALAREKSVGAGQGKLKLDTLARLAGFAIPVAARLAHNMLLPDKARANFDECIETNLASAHIPALADQHKRLLLVVKFIRERTANALRFLLPKFIPVFGPSMGSLNLLTNLSGDANLALAVTRGLPHNVTTEMDLALWQTAVSIEAGTGCKEHFQTNPPEVLASQYLAGELPAAAQQAVEAFLLKYGMRGIGEIDFGQKRWREDPTPVMHTLQSYLNADPGASPGVMFARGEQAAVAAAEEITAMLRKQPGGWLKEKLARAAIRRIRLLMGARESPKFFAIRTMGIARQALLEIGQSLAQAGTIEQADDLSYLNLDELEKLARQGLEQDGTDWKALVAARRATFEREARRKQVPRVLVSDGRVFYEGIGSETDTGEQISGSPVSPGSVEGIVHVVLDPRNTQLAPGEILVCRGTDPAWTPLFMVAGGLITEVGGMMTHGSVVAREYGIPAVVGVHQATLRLKDGQKIRMDGTTGRIMVDV